MATRRGRAGRASCPSPSPTPRPCRWPAGARRARPSAWRSRARSRRPGVRTGEFLMPKMAPSRATTTRASGNQNSQCQDRCSTIGPAATMPTPIPTPKIAETSPMVTATFSGGTSSRTMPIDNGRIAPAAPCRTRATMRTPRLGASAATRVPTRSIGEHGDEGLALADHVAEAADDRRQHRCGQQVGGQDPAGVAGGRAEVVRDGRQSRCDQRLQDREREPTHAQVEDEPGDVDRGAGRLWCRARWGRLRAWWT